MAIDINWQNANKKGFQFTHIWAGDITTGNFVLNQTFANFDFLLYEAHNDSYGLITTRKVAHHFIHNHLGRCDTGVWTNFSDEWRGTYSGDNVTFVTSSQNSRMRNIWGVKLV